MGSPVINVPELTIASNAEYERQLDRTGPDLRASTTAMSAAATRPIPQVTPLYRPAYTIADVRLGGRRERYEVALFVKNITNEHANLADASHDRSELPGQPHFVVNRPLTAGVEARVRFK